LRQHFAFFAFETQVLPLILHIESSTLTCSVALAADGALLALRETHGISYSHAEKLTVFIQEVLRDAGITAKELDAVCVASGPGSYTGLRIGVSAAKGLCYAMDIPLLSVNALQSLALRAIALLPEEERHGLRTIRPMIDARRMEVYTAAFDMQGHPLTDIAAVIVDHDGFGDELTTGPVLFVGDGAQKCREVLAHPNARFRADILPSAQGMFALAEWKLAAGEVEDVAYFEPFYLKSFVAGKKAV